MVTTVIALQRFAGSCCDLCVAQLLTKLCPLLHLTVGSAYNLASQENQMIMPAGIRSTVWYDGMAEELPALSHASCNSVDG